MTSRDALEKNIANVKCQVMKNLQNYTKKHANDGAYIRKRRDREDAYQNGKYVKIEKDEVIINLLNGPIIGIKGEKKSIIMNKKTDLVCGDATPSVAYTHTKAANGNVFKCTIASEIDAGLKVSLLLVNLRRNQVSERNKQGNKVMRRLYMR